METRGGGGKESHGLRFLNFLRGMETLFRHLVKCANSFLPKLP